MAVATLTNFESLGYISNVGSLRSLRREGFGKTATLYCIQESIKNSNSQNCLATEEGHYPDSFYQKIGFDTQFSALGYTKKCSLRQ